MEELLELLLGGGLRLDLFSPDLLALDRDLPKSDVLALLMLERRGEAIMSELAADVGVPLSTATGIGGRLTRKGLVERQRHPDDRRVILVRLTPAGRELAGLVRAQLDALIARITAALTPEEISQLMALIQKVFAGLRSATPSVAEPTQQTARRIPIGE